MRQIFDVEHALIVDGHFFADFLVLEANEFYRRYEEDAAPGRGGKAGGKRRHHSGFKPAALMIGPHLS
jgi:hypothetical protein